MADNQPMPPTLTPTTLPTPRVMVNLPSDVIDKLTQHDPSPNWAETWTAIGTHIFTYFALLAHEESQAQVARNRRPLL
jgi:hypothetical protein